MYNNKNQQHIKEDFIPPTLESLFFTTLVVVIRTLVSLGMFFAFLKKKSKIDEKYQQILREITKDENIKVKVIKSSRVVNAFSVPGWTIYWFTGLEKQVNMNEKEITAILLHEYGHYIKSHATKSTIFNIFNSITSVTVGVTLFMINPILTLITINILYNLFNITYKVTIGRQHEMLADSYAKKYGYEKHMISALSKLEIYTRKKVCKNIKGEDKEIKCDDAIRRMHRFDEHLQFKDRIEKLRKDSSLKAFILSGNIISIKKYLTFKR